MSSLRTLVKGGAFFLLLGSALAISYLSFQRKVDSFNQGPLPQETRVERGAVVLLDAGEEAWQRQLLPGDRILLVDGVPVASLENPLQTLSRGPFPHRLAVVRGQRVVAAEMGRPPVRIDLPYLFLAFVAILYLLIGLTTLFRDRSRAALIFAFFCVSAFAIQVITPTAPVDGVWKLLWLSEDVFRALAPALLLHFFLMFPTPSRGRRWPLYLAPALFLGSELFLSIPGAPVPASKLPFFVEVVERFWMLYFAAYAAAAVVRIVAAARRPADASAQRQARWIALGCTVGLAPFLVFYALPRAFGHASTWAACAGVVPLVFVPLGFAYAILRWRLWDVDIFTREIAATTAAVFLGAVSFVLVNTFLNKALADVGSAAKNLLAYGSGIFLASLLAPVKRRFSDAIERFQYGDAYRARRALLDFSTQWRGIRDLDVLGRALADGVAEAIEVSPSRLFLFERGLPPGISREAMEERLARADFTRVRSATFPSGEDLTFLRLQEDGYRYLFALKSSGRLIGVLAVGLKEGGIPLSMEDVALLQTVASQASLAFENAELYRTLGHRMDEIRALQEFQDGVIRSSSAGIVVIDSAGRLVSANPAFERLAGRPESGLLGMTLGQILPGAADALDSAGLEAGQDRTFELPMAGEAGRERIFRISAAPLSGSSGARVLLVDDITERVELEKGLSEKERLASLGVLAAGVAHEVNTPLAGISSYAQMLLADTDRTDPRYEILKKMERQTFRASRLVGDLLEFARGRHGAHEPIDLAAAVRDAIESCDTALSARGMRVEAHGLDAPQIVSGNSRELEQVFVNLLINARDASPDGARIDVTLVPEAATHVVRVKDHGKGLSEEEARRAFEPFFTTRHSGGTGLGLAISREIVERHGGTISLAPSDEGGAVATVTLPR
jgi:two-component system NtrC family sensor kinase